MGQPSSSVLHCIKYPLFLLNLLLLIGGCLILTIGILTVNNNSFFEEKIGVETNVSIAYIMLISGAVTVVISFMGCFGAIKEIRCMLVIYSLVLFLLFVVMLVGGLLCYLFRERISNEVIKTLNNDLNKNNQSDPKLLEIFDFVQTQFECCGMNGVGDWKGQLPSSCCKSKPVSCGKNMAYKDGCEQKLEQYIASNANLLTNVGIGVACALLVTTIFSLALFKMIQ